MRSNYKKLCGYIRPVDERNNDGALGEDNLYGISVTKEFIISHANLVGVTFDGYKVVAPRQFAYIPDTSRRGDKIAISLNTFGEKIIVSSICSVFEIIDENKLLPEYLMLWFMRPEFDRYARFMSNGSAREVFDWDCMCGVELPVPPLPEQRKIVRDYQVITDRIALLRKINDNLESSARTIYKSWFEDYEPFGGEMPANWFETTIGDLAQDVVCGKTPPTASEENYGGKVPFITIPDMHGSVYAVKTERTLSDIGVKTQANKTLPENSICVSCIATVGLVCLTAEPSQTNQQINSIICKPDISPFYVYLKMTTMEDYLKALGTGGSTTLNVNKTLFSDIKMLYPDRETVSAFHRIVEPMFSTIRKNQLELESLSQLALLIMASLSGTKGA